MTVHSDGVQLQLGNGSNVRTRLVLDCMGHQSPIVRQIRCVCTHTDARTRTDTNTHLCNLQELIRAMRARVCVCARARVCVCVCVAGKVASRTVCVSLWARVRQGSRTTALQMSYTLTQICSRRRPEHQSEGVGHSTHCARSPPLEARTHTHTHRQRLGTHTHSVRPSERGTYTPVGLLYRHTWNQKDVQWLTQTQTLTHTCKHEIPCAKAPVCVCV